MDLLAMGLGPERFFRARGYGWFAGGLRPVVALQALLTAALARAALRTALPGLGERGHLAAGLGLAAAAALPGALQPHPFFGPGTPSEGA